MRSIIINSAIVSFLLLQFACKQEVKKDSTPLIKEKFNAESLTLKEKDSTKKVRGQLLYMPIYSNVPYHERGKKYDLSAFVAIHNTDLEHPIKVTRVLFFDNDGNLVGNYLKKDTFIHALGATNFFISEKDQSGTGANFLVEWVSDTLVNEPLVETVMLGLTAGQGISFSSVGKIIREKK